MSRQAASHRVNDFTLGIARSLRQVRQGRGFSLGDLSARSGVSRAMLSQVESGKTTPSIAVLWKIATGLGIPFSGLLGPPASDPAIVLRRAEARAILSHDGGFQSRPLFVPDPARRIEFYELTIAAGARSRSRPHTAGTIENVAVARGRLRLEVGDRVHELGTGDAIEFPADVAHAYGNPGRTRCIAYDVIVYR